MVNPMQGEVWWVEAEDKRRPALIVTRTHALPVLSVVTVAPVTTRIRNIEAEVPLGRPEGLPRECVANFDNIQQVPKSLLVKRVGELGPLRSGEICRALAAVAEC